MLLFFPTLLPIFFSLTLPTSLILISSLLPLIFSLAPPPSLTLFSPLPLFFSLTLASTLAIFSFLHLASTLLIFSSPFLPQPLPIFIYLSLDPLFFSLLLISGAPAITVTTPAAAKANPIADSPCFPSYAPSHPLSLITPTTFILLPTSLVPVANLLPLLS